MACEKERGLIGLIVNTFFIFGDLSVKVEGSYRLKLSLFQITE
jgi:hypothetical protein